MWTCRHGFLSCFFSFRVPRGLSHERLRGFRNLTLLSANDKFRFQYS
ncbi:hypothetical protein BN135_436 [Cronobacter muytjensii 530]